MRHREASLERCSLNPHDRIGEDSTKTVGRRNGPSASTDPVFSVDFLKTNAHAGTTRKRGRMGVGF